KDAGVTGKGIDGTCHVTRLAGAGGHVALLAGAYSPRRVFSNWAPSPRRREWMRLLHARLEDARRAGLHPRTVSLRLFRSLHGEGIRLRAAQRGGGDAPAVCGARGYSRLRLAARCVGISSPHFRSLPTLCAVPTPPARRVLALSASRGCIQLRAAAWPSARRRGCAC
ncbi:hypothetical protein FB451DRAFT_1300262, partial [Mycena latifolia]